MQTDKASLLADEASPHANEPHDLIVWETVENPWGSIGKPLTAKPWGLRPLGFAALGLPLENSSGAFTLLLSTV